MGCKTLFLFEGKEDEFTKIRSNPVYRRLCKSLLSLQSRLAVLSKTHSLELRKIYNQNEILVLSTMVDYERFRSEDKNINLPLRILFCGSLFRKKEFMSYFYQFIYFH